MTVLSDGKRMLGRISLGVAFWLAWPQATVLCQDSSQAEARTILQATGDISLFSLSAVQGVMVIASLSEDHNNKYGTEEMFQSMIEDQLRRDSIPARSCEGSWDESNPFENEVGLEFRLQYFLPADSLGVSPLELMAFSIELYTLEATNLQRVDTAAPALYEGFPSVTVTTWHLSSIGICLSEDLMQITADWLREAISRFIGDLRNMNSPTTMDLVRIREDAWKLLYGK